MSEPNPLEDQSTAKGFQADATGAGVMASLAKADRAVQPSDVSPLIVYGTATGGTTESAGVLLDDTQAWDSDVWQFQPLVIEHDGARTRHTILANGENSLVFGPPLGTTTEATGLVGSGESPEGQVLCTLVDKGADGDNWVLHLISEADGVEGSMTNVVGADVESKIITVFIDTNGLGEQQQLLAGSLAQLLSESVPGHISAATEVISGSLPLGTVEAPVVVTFSGGVDAASVTAGDRYWILPSQRADSPIHLDTFAADKAALDAITDQAANAIGLTLDTATLYLWDDTGEAWVEIGPLQGDEGDPGPAIEVGLSETHIRWRVVGAEEWTNLIALADLEGSPGSNGNTILSGAVDPTDEGVDGDFYLNTATSTLFGPKASGTWPAGVLLKGADGDDAVVPDQVSAGEIEAGTETDPRLWSPADVVAAIDEHAEAGGATTLAGLTDVDVTTAAPTDGQALVWDEAGEVWVPGDAGGSGTIGGSTGSTDNAILRADGAGGATVQAGGLNLVLNDNGALQFVGTATTPNAPGAGAVDLQTNRNAATKTASGTSAFASGVNNTASGTSSVAMGDGTIASGVSSTATGSATGASGNMSFAAGHYGQAQGYGSFVFGYGGTALNMAQLFSGVSGGSIGTGASIQPLNRTTTDATQTALNVLTTTYRHTVPAKSLQTFIGTISAFSNAADGYKCAGWEIKGMITRDASNNTRIVGTPTITLLGADADAAGWNVISVSANDTNESLEIIVTGEAGTSILWTGAIFFSQSAY